MLGLSLPMDLLTVPHEQGTPQTILDLRAAVDDRQDFVSNLSVYER